MTARLDREERRLLTWFAAVAAFLVVGVFVADAVDDRPAVDQRPATVTSVALHTWCTEWGRAVYVPPGGYFVVEDDGCG